ncbi:hypothetical protein [Amycolatopsis albispora]|uniref:Uncharacterized protein n=1 Tax=Amycolatopsis albispora TaxID=1804986 RepID=A0A344L6E1_9PSEU|nr:hypothetical protein [Amycolatopsis albispora]AXB43615.1 hypothetical protein A4R43_14600 [Amycolatopsis albispora]
MNTENLARAREFLATHARLLERRLAEVRAGAHNAAPGVLAALAAYRNPDGGLGHALEPDVRAPESQPLAVDFGLAVLAELVETVPSIREDAAAFAAGLLPYLESVASPGGGLRIVTPSITAHPHAAHWGDGRFPPGLNPTANIVARLCALGLSSAWLDEASRFCRTEIERALEGELDAHTALNVLTYLESTEDEALTAAFEAKVPGMTLFHLYPGAGYGLTPLDFVPHPESPRARLFPREAIEAHLDQLEKAQDADGGWPMSWAPPGPAAELEWRGVLTLHAISQLDAYGR